MFSFLKKPFGLPAFMPKAFGDNFTRDYDEVKVLSKRYIEHELVCEAEKEAALSEGREPVYPDPPEGMYKYDVVRVPRCAEEPAKEGSPSIPKRRWRSVGALSDPPAA